MKAEFEKCSRPFAAAQPFEKPYVSFAPLHVNPVHLQDSVLPLTTLPRIPPRISTQ
ncbi:hypothetical protein PILCRDRAFT_819435 [Piloderma croceum F 1598]|uniref:Uncharacterized protein n=1 Tax=Piloderma croceum (strain F 1598) TaxID=765440 RepID=A0A0C3FYC6_PILCF|nr:hypothetical protein PILCRDRAFT_819435 [Piloderma croceum F 1598]